MEFGNTQEVCETSLTHDVLKTCLLVLTVQQPKRMAEGDNRVTRHSTIAHSFPIQVLALHV